MAQEKQGHEGHDIYDLGLQADLAMWLRKPVERRRILKLGTLGIGMLLAGCGAATVTATTSGASTGGTASGASAAPSATAGAASASASAAASSAAATTATVTSEIPQETAGPYPADGSRASNQTINALTLSGIVRSDIRTSLGTGTVAQGIPTTFELTLVNPKTGAPLAGYALYAWHCDREGRYSLYSSGVTGEDYLRGVQVADASGKLAFTSIFPGCYAGRWPHVHFEVYPSLDKATAASNAIHTSQLALPEEVCKVVYATVGYSQSIANLSRITLASDNVFSDGTALQMATVTGDTTNGYVARLTVGVEP